MTPAPVERDVAVTSKAPNGPVERGGAGDANTVGIDGEAATRPAPPGSPGLRGGSKFIQISANVRFDADIEAEPLTNNMHLRLMN